MAFDLHKNFAYSLIAVAPTPASSGTTFSVTAGEGTIFPAVPFEIVVWPAGTNPSTTNAEVLRVTSKGTGDNWTATRTQESSSARAIAIGDQVAAAITAKVVTDIEAAVATARTPGGRLTLTTALPVTPTDVLAATTLYYAFYVSNVVPLYSGTAWIDRTFTELSIAVPATTNTMYDVFIFDNAGTPTLELLAWSSGTTRATALVLQDGKLVKNGATTRLYVGSFRTTAVSGQTEHSDRRRFVWNKYNRVRQALSRLETTATWTYTTAVNRQTNANVLNQVEIVTGWAETQLTLSLFALNANSTGGISTRSTIGEDDTAGATPGVLNHFPQAGAGANISQVLGAQLNKTPVIGYHYYSWNEFSAATGTTTWYGTGIGTGLSGSIDC